jgi:hypothetical protein
MNKKNRHFVTILLNYFYWWNKLILSFQWQLTRSSGTRKETWWSLSSFKVYSILTQGPSVGNFIKHFSSSLLLLQKIESLNRASCLLYKYIVLASFKTILKTMQVTNSLNFCCSFNDKEKGLITYHLERKADKDSYWHWDFCHQSR